MDNVKDIAGAGNKADAKLQSLQEEIRRRDDFLALAAHELRNPLHALGLQLTVARAAAKSAGAEDAENLIEQARATLNRYVARASILLELIRLGAHAYPIDLQIIDLSDVLQKMLVAARRQAEHHGAQLHFIAQPMGDVCTDQLVVEQIVGNLLSNAFEHSGATDVQLILRQADAGHIDVVVADNGRGISEVEKDRIFDKFIGSGSKTEHGASFGLGLWIARELSHALSGRLLLESTPGIGAAFILRIPVAPAAAES